MTPEMVEYYRAMLLVGIRDKFDAAFDRMLEEENPLSDFTLSLCDCISDINAVLHTLREYTLDHTVDERVVCDLILADIRARYDSGEMSRVDVVTTLYNIARALDKWWDEPWDDCMVMSYDLELYEEGIISKEVFVESFDAWFSGVGRLDTWELQRKWNKQKKQTTKVSFWKRLWSKIRKS